MKRILSLFLALLLAFSLVACDGETPDNATPADTSTPPADDGTAPDTEIPSTPEPEPPTLAMYTLEDDEAEFLRSLMEDTAKCQSIDASAAQGEVNVVEAMDITPCNHTLLPEELQNIHEPTLVIYDERELYPDASGDYVYVLYVVEGIITRPIRTLVEATCEGQTLHIRTRYQYYSMVEPAVACYLLVFKIEKSSLNPGITQIEPSDEIGL